METPLYNQNIHNYFSQLRQTQPSINQPFIDQIVTHSTNKCLKSLQTSQLKIQQTPQNLPPFLQGPKISTSISNQESIRNTNIYKSLNQISKDRRNREERMNERVTRLMEQMKAKEQQFQEKQKEQRAQLHKQLHDNLQSKVNQYSQESKMRMKHLQEKSLEKPGIPLYQQNVKKFLKKEKELEKQKEEIIQEKKEKIKKYDVQKVKEFQKEYEIKKSLLPKKKKNSFHYTPPKNRSHFYDLFALETQHLHNKTFSPNESAIKYDPWKQIPVKVDPEKQKEMHQRLQKLQQPAQEQIFPLMAHQNTYDFRAYAIKNINKNKKKEANAYERKIPNNSEVYEMGKNYLSEARKVIQIEQSQKNSLNETESENPNANFQKQLYELGRKYLKDQSQLISQKSSKKHQDKWQQIINDSKLTENQKKEQIELFVQRIDEKVKRKEKLQKAKKNQISLNENENQEIDLLLLESIKAKLSML